MAANGVAAIGPAGLSGPSGRSSKAEFSTALADTGPAPFGGTNGRSFDAAATATDRPAGKQRGKCGRFQQARTAAVGDLFDLQALDPLVRHAVQVEPGAFRECDRIGGRLQ